ncbi:Spy/CpxP family protein refolding chaperone [candidate division WOR-3 bacterium]|nr:Spy/CpxP family protein refolding chaperone [candidate division WOR-3 bacterium]
MKRVTKITTIAVLALLVVTGWAIAQSPKPEQTPAPVEQPMAPPCHEMGMPGMGKMNMPELTDAQREQIQNLRIKHLKEVMPMETELKIKDLELAMLWQAEKFDAKQIIAKVKEINELRNKLELARVNHQIEIYNLLTPEQRKAFRPGMGMGRGMMRGRGGMGRRARQCHFGEGLDGPGAMPCCPQR